MHTKNQNQQHSIDLLIMISSRTTPIRSPPRSGSNDPPSHPTVTPVMYVHSKPHQPNAPPPQNKNQSPTAKTHKRGDIPNDPSLNYRLSLASRGPREGIPKCIPSLCYRLSLASMQIKGTRSWSVAVIVMSYPPEGAMLGRVTCVVVYFFGIV